MNAERVETPTTSDVPTVDACENPLLRRIPGIRFYRSIQLSYKKKYNPKDTPQLLGGWMRPGSFSSIVNADGDTTLKGMISMNYLVFLNAQAGELEKILSGIKSMLVKDLEPTRAGGQPVSTGDSLYFLRSADECIVRVKATVIRVYYFTNNADEDQSHILKEMQPRLQLTEDQYNHWSAKKQVLLIEFDSAKKINAIHVAPIKIADQPDWIVFEEINQIM